MILILLLIFFGDTAAHRIMIRIKIMSGNCILHGFPYDEVVPVLEVYAVVINH